MGVMGCRMGMMRMQNGFCKRRSFAAGSQVAPPEIHRLLSLPSHEQSGVLGQQRILLGRPLRLVILLGVDLIEGTHVARHAIEFADDDGEGGVVLLGEYGEEFCKFAEREVLGGKGEFGLGGGLREDALVDDLEQVLHFPGDLHLAYYYGAHSSDLN